MFKAITGKFDELFLMEFFRQTRRVNKEKNFKRKVLAFRELIKICDKYGIKKTSKFSFMWSVKLAKKFDPALAKLAANGYNFLLANLMPKDTVDSYKNYCREMYG